MFLGGDGSFGTSRTYGQKDTVAPYMARGYLMNGDPFMKGIQLGLVDCQWGSVDRTSRENSTVDPRISPLE